MFQHDLLGGQETPTQEEVSVHGMSLCMRELRRAVTPCAGISSTVHFIPVFSVLPEQKRYVLSLEPEREKTVFTEKN